MKQKGDSNKKDKMKGELCACKTVKNLKNSVFSFGEKYSRRVSQTHNVISLNLYVARHKIYFF